MQKGAIRATAGISTRPFPLFEYEVLTESVRILFLAGRRIHVPVSSKAIRPTTALCRDIGSVLRGSGAGSGATGRTVGESGRNLSGAQLDGRALRCPARG